MSRVDENKLQKKNSLMDTAFQLFTSQGMGKTSIAEIAQQAG
ncbi:MAG: TetR family transcriptional regulator, partial [Clostridia bacterium]|nr:TetR family transcriptional regulator [Clostridia bacterium]